MVDDGGVRLTPLNREQRRIVEEIAHEQRQSCRFCGSEKWRAPLDVRPSKGDWRIYLWCAACGEDHRMLQLSREEAATRLDLHP